VGSAPEPERTCVGCGETAGKATLIRLVRPPGEDRVLVDGSGSAPGRGAYLHADAGCLAKAQRRGSVARALRAGVGQDEVGRLTRLIEGGT